MAWSRRVNWCTVVAVPVVALSVFFDPVDTFASVLQIMLGHARAVGPRVWVAGDVAPGWRLAVRPPDRRPRRGRRTTSKPRGRVRP